MLANVKFLLKTLGHKAMQALKLTSIILLSIAFSFPAGAATKKNDPRRTLYAKAGEKTIVLEAPRGMCFLDGTKTSQKKLYHDYQSLVKKEGGQTMLAVFMSCDAISDAGISLPEGVLPGAVVISWLNPMIGEETDLSRQDYLDMREASFVQYMGDHAGGLAAEAAARRTANAVAQGLTGEEKGTKISIVRATTTLRQAPIEVTFRYASDPPALDNVYPLVEKFIAQQIALND